MNSYALAVLRLITQPKTTFVHGEKEKMIDWLIEFIKSAKSKNEKAYILQRYVQIYGAIPNEYAESVRKAMEDETN